VSVTGSRYYPFTKEVWDGLKPEDQLESMAKGQRLVRVNVKQFPNTWGVVSGGAKGPDTWAIDAAKERGLQTTVLLPDWKRYGRGAGQQRNKAIALLADSCLVFWDGESPGTNGFIKIAFKLRRNIYLVGPTGQPWAIFDEDYWKGFDFTKDKMVIPRGH